MEYVLTSLEAKKSDLLTINNGISSLELMELAGEKIYDEIVKIINKSLKILIVVGNGGNGGDGYVIARKLFNNGYNLSFAYSLKI
mgnify:CR=1 FL=1